MAFVRKTRQGGSVIERSALVGSHSPGKLRGQEAKASEL